MCKAIRAALVAFVISVTCTMPVISKPFEDGLAAYYQGDYAAVAQWYRKAADQGDADAQYNLGVMYAAGRGVSQNYVLAHMWWNLAAAAGEEDAINNRDIVAEKMTPTQIAEAQRLARNWEPK